MPLWHTVPAVMRSLREYLCGLACCIALLLLLASLKPMQGIAV